MNEPVRFSCPACGRSLPPGHRRCPSCQPPPRDSGPRREPALLAILAVLIALFAGTTAATRFHRQGQAALAAEWYERGVRALDAGQPGKAIAHLRTALVYSRDDRQARFRLAEALEAAGRPREARAYLLQLWDTEPGSGPINRHLARLAAGDGDEVNAVRYYQNAIYGLWERDADAVRRDLRFELVEFLLSRGLRAAAQAELLVLAEDLPDVAETYVRVARQFRQAGAIEPALETFQRALALEPDNVDALAGLGRMAFERGDYRDARHYLLKARTGEPGREALADLLEMSTLIVDIDPFDRRLAASVRRGRVIRAVRQAWTRLMGCLPVGPLLEDAPPRDPDLMPLLEMMRELTARVTDRGLRQDPDLADAAMDVVFAVQEAASRACGPPTGLDRALLLLGRPAEGAAR